mgnify:CR=1 FL=1
MGWLDWLRPTKRAAPAEAELFDEAFQRKLEYLAVASRRLFAGRMRAERRTRISGSGIEFADHRPYTPGDDLRALDWSVYGRTERLLVKRYEEEEDLSIYFIIDSSSSMGFGDGEKLRHAKRLCAALAYVALANLDRVTIVSATDEISGRMPETRGKARIFRIFRFLKAVKANGTTDLGEAMKTFVAQHKRRGLAVMKAANGESHSCAGQSANLIPDSDYARARMEAIFGSTDRGMRAASRGAVKFERDDPLYVSSLRTTRCDAQGSFSFAQVPDGIWYATTSIKWQGTSQVEGGSVMRRVDVRGGRLVKVVLP